MTGKSKKERLPELSRLEREIMQVVWALGECSSSEVIAAHTREPALAGTTIKTVLANLRKKGYVEIVPSMERGYRLRPTVAREQVARRSIRHLLADFFDGSPRHAVAYLLNDPDITAEDLEEIRRMVETRNKERE